jgi:hypothetical protein
VTGQRLVALVGVGALMWLGIGLALRALARAVVGW